MSALPKVQYITDENGQKTSIIMPVESYEELLEDIDDLVSVAERKNEISIPFDQVIESLKKNGVI